MRPDDVVVTGVGMVTPLGADAGATAQAWREGKRAERRGVEELAGTPLEGIEAAALPPFDPAGRLGTRRMLKYMSEAAVLGCVAAHEAVVEAGVRDRFAPEAVGLYAGTGLAATSIREVIPMVEESIDEAGSFSCRLLGERGLATTNPLLSFKILANMPPCLVSILEDIKGPSLIFTPWESGTAAALVEAWRAVTEGEVACALAGAADDVTNPATLVHLWQEGLLGESEIPAPAGTYVVMERAEAARRDGRRVHARVGSVRLTSAAYETRDPLAARMGRTFAAAPAVEFALACLVPGMRVDSAGTDRHGFTADLEGA